MNRAILRVVLIAALAQSGSATADDICDQIRAAAESSATTTAERLRLFREYQECKRNLQEQEG